MFSFYRAWPLICLLTSLNCLADSFSAQAPIIDGDLAQARQFALRQILNDASLSGHIDIVAASAQVGQQFKQRTLISSQSRVRAIRVLSESVENSILTLSLEMDIESKAPSTCSPRFLSRHTTVALTQAINALPPGEAREKAGLFLERLSQHLPNLSPLIWPGHETAESPSYILEVELPRTYPLDPDWKFHLSGANGKRITTLNYPLGKETLASRQTVSLGYANLRKLALTRHGENLAGQIAQDIAAILRCLPVVVAIPGEFSGDEIRLSGTPGNQPSSSPVFALYSERFPVTANGRIDLLRIDRILDVRTDDTGTLLIRTSRTKATPGLTPGGFIVLQ